MERRYLEPTEIEVRAGEGDAGPVVSGYAAVFDSEAHNEIIRAGAFTKTLKESENIRALWNHESGMPLASTATDTLELSEDKHGLRFEMTLDEGTTFGADALRTIEKRLVTGVSFGFDTVKDIWTERGTPDDAQQPLRELLEVRLYEVSPVTFPWYEDTEVAAKEAFSLVEIRALVPALADADRTEIKHALYDLGTADNARDKDTFTLAELRVLFPGMAKARNPTLKEWRNLLRACGSATPKELPDGTTTWSFNDGNTDFKSSIKDEPGTSDAHLDANADAERERKRQVRDKLIKVKSMRLQQ